VTIVFYISGHGFGHASRQVEVINVLGRMAADATLIIRTDASADLLRRTLRVPAEVRPGACDAGVVQTSSVDQDADATLARALDFYRSWDARIGDEADALAPVRPTVIVGDIPPLAFAVADRLGAPSLAIANFTWDWIYETLPGFGSAGDLLSLIRSAYGRATLALRLPLSEGFDVFANVRPSPFVARRPRLSRLDARRALRLNPARRIALLSFGGYGLPALNLPAIDCLDEWTVVTTDRVTPGAPELPPEVIRLDEQAFADGPCRYEDLVQAADVVITKPGYGIIADCIAADTAMVYTSRGPFREYDLLVAALPRYVRARFISQTDLFAGRWRDALTRVVALPQPPQRPATDGAVVAATTILELARRQSSQPAGAGLPSARRQVMTNAGGTFRTTS